MLSKIFVMRDSKAGFYGVPFFEVSRGSALRGLTEAVRDKQSTICKYPEDFSLFEIGEWDNVACKMLLNPAPVHVINAIDLVIQDIDKVGDPLRPLDKAIKNGLSVAKESQVSQ